jgi:hypothetical protein
MIFEMTKGLQITGANGIVLGYEPQLSVQTTRGMSRREGFRRRGGIRSVWDFTDPDHPGVGTVPYVRTPNLPASVIRVQKNPIAVRDGNYALEEGHCSPSGRLTRCPDRPYDPANPTDTGYCKGWHRILVPIHQSAASEGSELTLTRFIVEAAAGERVPFQHNGHHGWLPVEHWRKYVEANGPAASNDEKERAPSVRQGDRLNRCTEDRPVPEMRAEPRERRGSRTIVLESRAAPKVDPAELPVDSLGRPIPLCRFGCGTPASMHGPEGFPEHYSCRKKQEAAGSAA